MTLVAATRLAASEILAPLGAGGPASSRAIPSGRELLRGLAEAKELRCR